MFDKRIEVVHNDCSMNEILKQSNTTKPSIEVCRQANSNCSFQLSIGGFFGSAGLNLLVPEHNQERDSSTFNQRGSRTFFDGYSVLLSSSTLTLEARPCCFLN